MLILIAHGSHRPPWRASLEKLTKSLQANLGRDKVQLAYMQCTPPTLMDVVADAVRQDVQKIRVLPLFLTTQGHVDSTIVPLVDEVRRAHGSIEVELLAPVGQHPLFLDLLLKIATGEGG